MREAWKYIAAILFIGSLAAGCKGEPPPRLAQHREQPTSTVPGSACVTRQADSTAIVGAASAAVSWGLAGPEESLALRVTSYEESAEGVLVTLLPVQPVLGGGAVVRVPRGGCAVVREQLE